MRIWTDRISRLRNGIALQQRRPLRNHGNLSELQGVRFGQQVCFGTLIKDSGSFEPSVENHPIGEGGLQPYDHLRNRQVRTESLTLQTHGSQACRPRATICHRVLTAHRGIQRALIFNIGGF